MDHLTLIGDIDENFYQLGLIDRSKAKDVHRDVKLMLSTPWKTVNQAMEEVAKVVLKNSLLNKTNYYRHLKSYSEGLGQKIEDTAYVMLIPELVSCISKWAPGLAKGNFGCSSFFYKNQKDEVIHTRVLDFPLQGSYDQHERAISYQLNGYPKLLGFGSAGIPYPSITLMTEDGLTLALHQKFTNIFNKNGVSIFELIFDLVKNAKNAKEVIEYLNSHQSITTWSLYISFKNGDGLAADLMGDRVVVNQFEINQGQFNYFCNHLVDTNLNQENFMPPGFHQYNLMRESIAQKKLKLLSDKNEYREIEVLKYFATPIDQKIKKSEEHKKFKLDPITPSSLSVMSMNTTSGVSHYIPGEAPKYFRGKILEISHCFKDPMIRTIESKKNQTSTSEDYFLGMKAFMEAQRGFDLRDPQMVYHNLQLAIDHLENYPEKEIAYFYFNVAQYIYESHPKVLAHLLREFKKMSQLMPAYLKDQCLLFSYRLEKILEIPPTLTLEDINHSRLKNIYELEAKIPRSLLHISTKNMIFPRVDILDVIYAHTL